MQRFKHGENSERCKDESAIVIPDPLSGPS